MRMAATAAVAGAQTAADEAASAAEAAKTAADTAAQAQLTLGPVEPATSYTLGVSAGGRNPSVGTPSRCGSQMAVPMRRAGTARAGDSLFVSISGVRGGKAC